MGIHLRDVITQAQGAKARACHDGAEQPHQPVRVPEAAGEVVEPVGAIEVDECDALVGACGGRLVRNLVVGDAREHETVDFRESSHVEGIKLRTEI